MQDSFYGHSACLCINGIEHKKLNVKATSQFQVWHIHFWTDSHLEFSRFELKTKDARPARTQMPVGSKWMGVRFYWDRRRGSRWERIKGTFTNKAIGHVIACPQIAVTFCHAGLDGPGRRGGVSVLWLAEKVWFSPLLVAWLLRSLQPQVPI